jgi:hypothetical protein
MHLNAFENIPAPSGCKDLLANTVRFKNAFDLQLPMQQRSRSERF